MSYTHFILNGLKIEIKQDSYLAKVTGIDGNDKNIFIPNTISYDSHVYLITSIKKKSFKRNRDIEYIQFGDCSGLRCFEKAAFEKSSLRKIVIPRHVHTIEQRCFSFCHNLQKIEFPLDSELEIIEHGAFFDSHIESITIPSNLKEIGYEAFYNCLNLSQINFAPNSELNSIDTSAFCCCNFNHITLPPHLTTISCKTFAQCRNLKTIEFSEGSELTTIEKKAFQDSSIETLSIPSQVQNLNCGWCLGTYKLKHILISPRNNFFSYVNDEMMIEKNDLNDDFYENLVFVRRDIEQFVIPSFITKIKPYAFSECRKLKKLEIPKDSKLTTIEEKAFYNSFIESITIPSSVEYLQDGWLKLFTLKNLSIDSNNKFYRYYNDKLLIGTFGNSISFAKEGIECLIVPSFINRIDSYVFYKCKSLKEIIFFDDSQLCYIGKEAFTETSLESIIIPPKVSFIGVAAFYYCISLRKISFAENSQIETIGKDAFSSTPVLNMTIPPSVRYIKDAFYTCDELKTIEFLSDRFYDNICLYGCRCLFLVSFPNVKEISIDLSDVNENISFFVNVKTNLYSKFHDFENSAF
ncbi:hypothetical protein M9Y10_016372 [Tritrichomonas musculus]|uniref:Surface antigen BspA-like n=1 Tax=Tritrichomonas musculus TaxID=1915356 RepID=A0ABR2GJG5_9EUKA